MDRAKLIEILDPQAGTIRETELETRQTPSVPLFTNGQRMIGLREAATTYTASFPQLLQSGLRTLLFSEYAAVPMTSELWLKVEPSNKQFEDWVEGSTIGKLPIVPEGGDYPHLELDLDRAFQIRNDKRGGIISISEEAIMFDKTNLIRQQVEDLAGAMRFTEEDDAYSALTTGGNYTRNSTTNDNDIGVNTAATDFSASGLETALSTLRTMKDRKSGRYLGVNPRMLVGGVGLEWAAKQLLLSPEIMRQHGNTSAEEYGTGTSNPFRGQITEILITPYIGGRYRWVLMEPKKAFMKQVVWELRLVDKTQPNSDSHFGADVFQYKVSKFYGIGVFNDRFAYYSSTTNAPAVT